MNYALKILYIFTHCARSLHSYIFKFFINAQTSAAYLLSITSGACMHLKALTGTYIKSNNDFDNVTQRPTIQPMVFLDRTST